MTFFPNHLTKLKALKNGKDGPFDGDYMDDYDYISESHLITII